MVSDVRGRWWREKRRGGGKARRSDRAGLSPAVQFARRKKKERLKVFSCYDRIHLLPSPIFEGEKTFHCGREKACRWTCELNASFPRTLSISPSLLRVVLSLNARKRLFVPIISVHSSYLYGFWSVEYRTELFEATVSVSFASFSPRLRASYHLSRS